jgi:cation:H+ antiporter
MLAEFGWFVLGLLALTLGADSLLKGLSGLALRLGVSGFAVGVMAVLLGTSLPELSVNMSAMAVGAGCTRRAAVFGHARAGARHFDLVGGQRAVLGPGA